MVKLSRINYLKQKMRAKLASQIGDTDDNVADAVRAIVLGEAIRMGMVTDKAIVEQYTRYVQTLLDGYGGGSTIINILSGCLDPIYQQVVIGYFVAKGEIIKAETVDDVRMVDLSEVAV